MTTSKHYLTDRSKREALIKTIGEGKIIATFTVDKHHRNGPELHSITDTGIIIIRNKRTKKMITKLIARPAGTHEPRIQPRMKRGFSFAEFVKNKTFTNLQPVSLN